MIAQRLKQLRLARGWSLEELSAKMGGMVTKQSLSKYETGQANPSREVLNKMAVTLGVKAAYLWADSKITVKFIAYRSGSTLPTRARQQIESFVAQMLEERIRLQDVMKQPATVDIPVQKIVVSALDDAEKAAQTLRQHWNLGHDPIASVVDVLEGRGVHVLEIGANEKFDGIAAAAYDGQDTIKAAVVVTRRGAPGERQRMNLAHELGHLVLDIREGVDKEKAAFRFGAAFLAPADMVYETIGITRTYVQAQEWLMLKRQFGMSIQALLYRLHDLGVVNDSFYKQWWIHINRLGWKKREPLEMPPEASQWLHRNVFHALSEQVISREEAELMLGESIEITQPLSHIERREFMKLPLEERRRILAEQAEQAAKHYRQEGVDEAWAGGDLVEY